RSKGHITHRPKNPENILIFWHATEFEAFESEKAFIRWFGRKDLGTGCLRNLTDGGEGAAGHIPTPAMRRAMKMHGQKAKENGSGIHACGMASKGGRTTQQRHPDHSAANGRIGGRKNVESGHLAAIS